MKDINRSLMVVKPKQPFLDWLQSIEEEDDDLKLNEIREDSTAYLIPEYETLDDRIDILQWCAEFVFEQELNSWHTDSDLWPLNRDAEAFLDWFDIEFHSMVLDLDSETPLEHTDYGGESDESANLDPNSNGH